MLARFRMGLFWDSSHTLCLLKIKVFLSKRYDVLFYACKVTSKILSSDSNDIVDVVMWPKIGNSSISMGEVTLTSILKRFDQEHHFLRGALGSSSVIWDWHPGMALKFYTNVAKRLKLKVRVLGSNS